MTAYVVFKSACAFHVKSHHETLLGAAEAALRTSNNTFERLVRDGTDGKRYSISDCEVLAQKTPMTKPSRRRRR